MISITNLYEKTIEISEKTIHKTYPIFNCPFGREMVK